MTTRTGPHRLDLDLASPTRALRLLALLTLVALLVLTVVAGAVAARSNDRAGALPGQVVLPSPRPLPPVGFHG